MCVVEPIDRSGPFNRVAGTFRYQILADNRDKLIPDNQHFIYT